MLERLAALGYNRQLLTTQQHIDCGVGEAGNTGLQQATAGNSATQIVVLEKLATLGYNR